MAEQNRMPGAVHRPCILRCGPIRMQLTLMHGKFRDFPHHLIVSGNFDLSNLVEFHKKKFESETEKK